MMKPKVDLGSKEMNSKFSCDTARASFMTFVYMKSLGYEMTKDESCELGSYLLNFKKDDEQHIFLIYLNYNDDVMFDAHLFSESTEEGYMLVKYMPFTFLGNIEEVIDEVRNGMSETKKFTVEVYDIAHRCGEVVIEAKDEFEARQKAKDLYEADKIRMENCQFSSVDFLVHE